MPVLFGAKWGPSQANGTPGGVVTWSIVGALVRGVDAAYETGRSDVTTAASALASYNVEAILRRSFDAWSAISNIDFVQVRDDGSNVGEGLGADIRVAFGQIDGVSGDTLAQAFFPFDQTNPLSGDILVDSDERAFYADPQNLLSVVTHEIGHSIGLEHITGVQALMNPRVNEITEPVGDDIEGARRIYGVQDGGPVEIVVGLGPDLFVESGPAGLRMTGDERANVMVGGVTAEMVRGLAGDDILRGRGGADTLKGGGGDDALRGGGGNDLLVGGAGGDTLGAASGSDVLRGGGGDDFLRGGGGDDRLLGAAGADTLVGGGGADTVIGGGGDDVLTGGAGRDIFVFRAGAGSDTVTDFVQGTDLFDLSGHGGVSSFADLLISGDAADVRFADGQGGVVFVVGVAAQDLSEADFIF